MAAELIHRKEIFEKMDRPYFESLQGYLDPIFEEGPAYNVVGIFEVRTKKFEKMNFVIIWLHPLWTI